MMAAEKLEKAELRWRSKVPNKTGKIICQFNPTELSFSKGVSWSSAGNKDEKEGKGSGIAGFNAPKMAFGGGQSAKYSLTLFFDAVGDPAVSDVRAYTDQLLRLTLRGAGYAKIKQRNAVPPTVTFVWGKIRLFRAVVDSVNVSFTLFLADGTPVRAKATVSFTQRDEDDDVVPAQNPSSRTDPRKTHIVHAGQRLDQIAYDEYADARYWRLLAESNHLDDPFHLADGQILVIPPVD
jgi:hypothetical protein